MKGVFSPYIHQIAVFCALLITMPWIKKYWKVIGLIAILAYMSVIIGVWIYANLLGYKYFSAGEPLWYVKWFEWFMGAVGIMTAVHYLKLELRICSP